MKRNAFLRRFFARNSRPRRYLDFFSSYRWLRRATPRRSSGVGFSPSWELLEVRHALASDVGFVGLVAPPDAGSTSTSQQSPANTTIVSPFAVQAAAAQTVNSVVVGGLQFQGTFTS